MPLIYLSQKTLKELKSGAVQFSELKKGDRVNGFAVEVPKFGEHADIYLKKTITQKLRWQVFARDKFKCQRCNNVGALELHCDHIIPESKGGKTEIGNLQTLCSRCNLQKGSKKHI